MVLEVLWTEVKLVISLQRHNVDFDSSGGAVLEDTGQAKSVMRLLTTAAPSQLPSVPSQSNAYIAFYLRMGDISGTEGFLQLYDVVKRWKEDKPEAGLQHLSPSLHNHLEHMSGRQFVNAKSCMLLAKITNTTYVSASDALRN